MNDKKNTDLDKIDLGHGIEIGFFNISSESTPAEIDLQLATTVLLFEVVKSDGHIDRNEVARVIEILRERFSLHADQVGRLLELVSDDGAQSPTLHDFTDKIRAHWGNNKRLELLENFWVIAIADKIIDHRETELIERIANLLNLNDTDITAARQKAQKRLESAPTR